MKLLIALFMLLLINESSEAQIKRDTSAKNIFADSLAGNIPLIQPDTVRTSNAGAEDIITYEAKDSLVYDIKERKVYLYNTAVLKYKDLKLEAGRITVDEETEILEAYGMPDTAGSDLIIQQPLMFQGNEKYEGSRLCAICR